MNSLDSVSHKKPKKPLDVLDTASYTCCACNCIMHIEAPYAPYCAENVRFPGRDIAHC